MVELTDPHFWFLSNTAGITWERIIEHWYVSVSHFLDSSGNKQDEPEIGLSHWWHDENGLEDGVDWTVNEWLGKLELEVA